MSVTGKYIKCVESLEDHVIQNGIGPNQNCTLELSDISLWCGHWEGGHSVVWTDGINFWCEWFDKLDTAFAFIAALMHCRQTGWQAGVSDPATYPFSAAVSDFFSSVTA